MNLLSREVENELRDLVYTAQIKAIEDYKNQQSKQERYLSSDKAAKYCGVSKGTIDNWHRQEGLKRSVINQTVRYDTKELDRFMATRSF